jgi:hypothetical protein
MHVHALLPILYMYVGSFSCCVLSSMHIKEEGMYVVAVKQASMHLSLFDDTVHQHELSVACSGIVNTDHSNI